MEDENKQQDILWLFDLALVIKAIDGAIEVCAGVFVLFIKPKLVLWFVTFVTGGELAQDPGDIVATFLRNAGTTFAVHTHYLLSAYLVLHGAIKVLLVIGIFAGKRSAYPLFMGALVVFGCYEAYRGLLRHETLLIVMAVFDTALLALTAYEYRRRYPDAFTQIV